MELKTGKEQPYQGHLGRTAQTSVLISSTTGPVFPANIYTGVNITQNPELREDLFGGTLNHVECPFSARTYKLASPILYHNEELRVFALIIPDELRHEEFKRRSELLQQLAREREILPDYVRNFYTVFAPADLLPIEERHAANQGLVGPDEEVAVAPLVAAAPAGTDAAQIEARVEAQIEERRRTSDAELKARREELEAEFERRQLELQQELEAQRAAVEQERDRLEVERAQMAEVASRVERESGRIEEVARELDGERHEIEALRRQLEEQRHELEALRLNLEQEQLRLEQGAPATATEESTQVVTDDQFIEVVAGADDDDDELEIVEEEDIAGPNEVTHITTSPLEEAAEPEMQRVEPYEGDVLGASFDSGKAAGQDYFIGLGGDVVRAAWRLSSESLEAFTAHDVQLLVQFQEVDDMPLVAVVLAASDENDQIVASVGWPLDVTRSEHEAVLDRLARDCRLVVGLYANDGERRLIWEITHPLRQNIDWARHQAEERISDPDARLGSFAAAAAKFTSDDFERVGTMRHPFTVSSFEEAETASAAKLAASIAGFWSNPDKQAYLIGNRSFPLQHFKAIQERVVRKAVEWGIGLAPSLQPVAVELGYAESPDALVELLMANFAEVSVGIRGNDLDPLAQWENWEALIEMAQEYGVTPNPDVLELAELSFGRAQEFQENLELQAQVEADASDDFEILDEADLDVISADSLIVSKRSETTGVTYFLPDAAVLDTFDDLANMAREDLELLLGDANGRLEAAQMLIERFDASVTNTVLEAAESMNAPEIAALARFFETKADGLEAELVRCAESGGPSATLIAARALASIRSTSAIPVLLDALRDPKRQGDKRALAATMARYGDKLLPPLTRAIKRDKVDDNFVLLLACLERERPGTLDKLGRDRSKNLREAARQARRQL